MSQIHLPLDLWEVRRLLSIFEETSRDEQDKELWLKIKEAEGRLQKFKRFEEDEL